MPFIDVRDLRVYYEIRGSGPRVLGIGGTGGDLRRIPTAFDLLPPDSFEILAYDQRGLGRSSRPDIPYTMADYAEDAEALLRALGWERCLVIGFSFGGMAAQELALRYPWRVKALVLAATSSGGEGGSSYPLETLISLPREEYIRRIITLSDARRDAAWQMSHPEEFRLLREQTITALKIGEDEPGRRIGALRQLEARAGHNTCGRLRELKMPVYICGGRYDGIAEPSRLEALKRLIPQARMDLFEGGHFFFLQDPRAVLRIGEFLTGMPESQA